MRAGDSVTNTMNYAHEWIAGDMTHGQSAGSSVGQGARQASGQPVEEDTRAVSRG